MPATPAWPPKSTPRLFVDEDLEAGNLVSVLGQQAHYLLKVMRLKQDDPVKLFNDRSGEYLAEIANAGKRDLSLLVTEKLKDREAVPDVWLLQAPIKKDRFDWIAEKSCELGIAAFQPVLTARCVVDKIKEDRLRSHMIEAAEQCERTALPEIKSLEKLEILLKDWPEDRVLFFCDERGGEGFGKAIAVNSGPAAILIGPEGGFTDEENTAIRNLDRSVAVSLGPRILRADTAATAAISVWMSHAKASDWR